MPKSRSQKMIQPEFQRVSRQERSWGRLGGNSKNSVQVLSDPSSVITQIFAEESRKALSNLLIARGDPSKKEKVEKKVTISQPDEPIQFAQLMVRDGSDALEDELQKSLMAAVSGKIIQMSSRVNW